jgi:hypothetical protein
MPKGFLFRLLISLAFGIPSAVLWFLLRWQIKRGNVLPASASDWLKPVVFLLLASAVIAEALDRRVLANALNINFWGVFLVLNWLHRGFKVDTGRPIALKISETELANTQQKP